MAALTRRESEERQDAVLRYFKENPRATGDEAQAALVNGRLTGKKGPPMGIGMLYRLKRQADDELRKGAVRPKAEVVEMARPAGKPVEVSGDLMQALRDRARELQQVLAQIGGEVVEVHITKDGARVVRLRPSEENL